MKYTGQIIMTVFLAISIVVLTSPAFSTPALAGVDSDFKPKVNMAGDNWYLLKDHGSELDIRFRELPDDYVWYYGISNESIQITDSPCRFVTDGSGCWKAEFAPADSGSNECIVTFQCVSEDSEKPVETRKILVRTQDGKIKEVSEI